MCCRLHDQHTDAGVGFSACGASSGPPHGHEPKGTYSVSTMEQLQCIVPDIGTGINFSSALLRAVHHADLQQQQCQLTEYWLPLAQPGSAGGSCCACLAPVCGQ